MTSRQAGEQFALLAANYPRTEVGDETNDLWLGELEKLDYAAGAKAIRSLIAGSRYWPTIAHLNEQVQIVRQQAAQERAAAERREEQRRWDELELPPLREVPEAVALLDRFQIMPPSLVRVDDGPCDDCERVGQRCRIGRVDVCVGCARSRLRVADRLHNEAA